MKDKVKMGLILTGCLLLCLVIQYFSNFVFDFIIFALAMLGTIEFRKIQLKAGCPCFDYCPEIACFLVFVTAFAGALCGLNALVMLLIVIAIIVLFYACLYFGSSLIFAKELTNDPFRNLTNLSVKQFAFFKTNNTLSCIIYPSIPMLFMYFINHISTIGLVSFTSNTQGSAMGLFALILLFAICCLSDTFAMLFGVLIGGRKIFPKISPKKTISGSLFGLLGGVVGAVASYLVFSAIYPTVFHIVNIWQFMLVGLVGSFISQSGDLFESYMKRKAQVKDSGNFFRSHGGVLDRFDSIIFTTPYIFICVLFLFG